jgi:hypothetical protein
MSVPCIESPVRISPPRYEPSIPSCRAMSWAHSRAVQTSIVAESSTAEACFGVYTCKTTAPRPYLTYVGPVYRVARPYLATQVRTKYTVVSGDDVGSLPSHRDVGRSRVGDVANVFRRKLPRKTAENHAKTGGQIILPPLSLSFFIRSCCNFTDSVFDVQGLSVPNLVRIG